jgi:hypothetical protein
LPTGDFASAQRMRIMRIVQIIIFIMVILPIG